MNAALELDAYQQAAVLHGDGPAVVLAGPGAGKTRVLAYRVARLIAAGVAPGEILCVTFGNAAAAEMRERICKLTGIPARSLERTVSTFHALALRILVTEKYLLDFKLTQNPIADSRRVLSILRPLLRGTGLKLGAARTAISRIERGEADGTAESPELMGVYAAYYEAMKAKGWISFDQMVPEAVRLLVGNPWVLARWKFRHVIVDEAHDCSCDQAALAHLLSTGGVYVVGDKSQSIYSFRGGGAELLENPAAREYRLPINYRSALEIIEGFRRFADTDEAAQRLAREMFSSNGAVGVTTERGYATEEQEASEVVEQIAADSLPPKDVAILARTNAQLALFGEELVRRGVPVCWRSSFWNSPEIIEALALLRLAADPRDADAFRRVVAGRSRAFRFLGAKFAESVLLAAKRKGIIPRPLEIARPAGEWKEWLLDRWDAARFSLARISSFYYPRFETRPALLLSLIENEVGLGVDEDAGVDDFGTENLGKLYQVAAAFGSVKDLLAHAEKMQTAHTADGVTLSTIHRAKGLEWTAVYIVGVSEGILPHARATNLDEERRLLYVACSRARRKRSISWHGRISPLLAVRISYVGSGCDC